MKHKIGEVRERTGFAIIPFKINNQWVWWKFFTITEEFTEVESDKNNWKVVKFISW